MIRVVSITVVASLAALPGVAAAQSLTIDDFTTGKTAIVFSGAKQTSDFEKSVTAKGAHIIGRKRLTSLLVSLPGNPFRLNAQLSIAPANGSTPASLTLSSGFQMSIRAEFTWGNDVDAPLNVNLTSYDRFRVHYLALDGDQDIVMQTFSAAGDGEWGCSLAASPYHPVVVDMPFANSPGADLSEVTEIGAVIQGGAYGFDSGISLIEAVPAGTPPADVTCPSIQN